MAASSSTPSVASCAPTFKPTNSKDIRWKYNHLKNLNDRKVTCDFCNLTSSGEISRAKRHQLAITGDIFYECCEINLVLHDICFIDYYIIISIQKVVPLSGISLFTLFPFSGAGRSA